MELILIACSGKKTKGGTPDYPGSDLEKLLPSGTLQRLLRSRQELARLKNYPSGPDFGNRDTRGNILFKPAYLRYSGIVYEQSGFETLYPQIKGKIVLIISALYGILEAGDSIRDYNMKMDETLSNGNRLATWWRNHTIGSILEECILSIKPDTVHDLLSEVYRSALGPWPMKSLKQQGIPYNKYDYHGLGTGSLWHRGNDLKNLLITR